MDNLIGLIFEKLFEVPEIQVIRITIGLGVINVATEVVMPRYNSKVMDKIIEAEMYLYEINKSDFYINYHHIPILEDR